MAIKRVDHIGIAVADLAAAKGFLEGIGLECAANYGVDDWLESSFFQLGDVALVLIEMQDAEVGRRRLKGETEARIDHICFEVDDLDETISDLTSRGVVVAGGEFDSPEGSSVPENSYGTTRSVFTKPETSSGYTMQFVETTGSVADDIVQTQAAG